MQRTSRGKRSPRVRPTWAICVICGFAAATTACSSGVSGPAPQIEQTGGLPVDPGIICRDQHATEVVVHGDNLSPVPINVPKDPSIALPTITLARTHELDGKAGDDTIITYSGSADDLTNKSLLAWKSQKEMRFTVNQDVTVDGSAGLVPEGLYDVRVQNPNDKKDQELGALAVVKKPELTELSPGVLCLAQGSREVSLTGSTFLEIEGRKPTLSVDGVAAPFAITKLEECTKIAHEKLDASFCAKASVELAQDAIGVGYHAVTFENPQTADCKTEEKVGVLVVPPPVIAAVAPPVACVLDGMQLVTITGTGFLEVGGQSPEVKLGGQTVSVAKLSACEDLQSDGLTVRSCKAIELNIDTTKFPVGDVAVSVANPEPAGCSGSASAVFRIVGPPMVSSVAPSEICNGEPQSLTISGSGFDSIAQVSVDGVAANSVTYVSDTQLVAVVPEGLAAGPHAVTVSHVGTCTNTLAAAITVEPAPIVFFADPPVLYSPIPVQATVFTSGLDSNATKVELIADDTNATTNLLGFSSPTSPNKILANVPSGLSSGKYSVRVTNGAGCAGVLQKGLTVTSMTTSSLVASIKPSFVPTTTATAVTVIGAGLKAVPRVYLTPSTGGGTARALSAVEVKSTGDALTAVVPAGLTAGEYDLVVVNPDGLVDVIAKGVTVTSTQPPKIATVTPASLVAGSTSDITLVGSGFSASGITVALDCLTPGASGVRTAVTTTPQAVTAVPGGGTRVTVTVPLSSGSPVAPGGGSICLVRLTNPDGAFFEYSAVSVTNSSLNLAEWTTGPQLPTARRALSLVAGRPTLSSRYLYAIGGDSGAQGAVNTRGTAFDTVASANVDVFGGLDAWFTQRNKLPGARTLSGAATIGQFVYLLGGHNGTTATNSLWRAQILDPLAGPTISDIDAQLGNGQSGLTKGLYYYRVAAIYAGDDVANPSTSAEVGESLPGELLPVQLPERAEKINLTLKWSAVTRAHGYRVYRSPMPDAPASALALIGEIQCGAGLNSLCNCSSSPEQCRLLDNGKTADLTKTPLLSGSLGTWHEVNGARCSTSDCALNKAREGHATVAVRNPANANQWFLYAFGGRDDNGSYLSTYEVATVTDNNGTQVVSDFTTPATFGGPARAELGVFVMTSDLSSAITAGDVWLYISSGRGPSGAVDSMQAAELAADGTLNSPSTLDAADTPSGLAAYGYGQANNQLFVFSGGITSPATNSRSAKICLTSTGSGPCQGGLPNLQQSAFNALGNGAPNQPRMYAGSTQESAFFFLVGGHDGANALSSMEKTVQ